MADKDPQDTEIIGLIDAAGRNGIEPQQLINALMRNYDGPSVIEALQRAIERGKISLSSQGMVVSVREYAHAA